MTQWELIGNNYIWDKIVCLFFGTFGQLCVYRV